MISGNIIAMESIKPEAKNEPVIKTVEEAVAAMMNYKNSTLSETERDKVINDVQDLLEAGDEISRKKAREILEIRGFKNLE